MKAMVLAAGRGSRLRPMTDRCPKPMVSIAGRPLLEHTLVQLAAVGVRDIVINLHSMPEAITEHFGDGSVLGLRITYSPETTLLGTAGALAPWRACFDAPFLLVYGDNLSTIDYERFAAFHQARPDALATLALYWREDTAQSGIAETGADGRITRFIEKPKAGEAFSHWVNAGVMMLSPAVFDLLPPGPSDFSRDLLPAWMAAGRAVYGYRMSEAERLWWIDRPEDLAAVTEDFSMRSRS